MAIPPFSAPPIHDQEDAVWPPWEDEQTPQADTGIVPYADELAGSGIPPWAQPPVEHVAGADTPSLEGPAGAPPFAQEVAGPPGFVEPAIEPTVVADPAEDYQFAIDEVDPVAEAQAVAELEPPEDDLSFTLAETEAPVESPQDPNVPPPTLGMSQAELAANSAAREFDRGQIGANARISARDELQQDIAKENRRYENAQIKADIKMAEVEADLAELKGKEKDPQRYFKDMGVGRKIATFLSAMIGGYMAPLRGGKNTAMDLILKMIDKDIQAQGDDIANQRQVLGMKTGLVADLMKRNGDKHKAIITARYMAQQVVLDKLNDERALVDPRGTRAQVIAGAVMKVQGAQASAMQEGRATLLKEANEQSKQDEIKRSHLANEQNTAAARRATNWRFKQGQKHDMEKAKLERDIVVGKEARDMTVHGMVDVSGKPIIANSVKDADTIKSEVILAADMNRVIGKLLTAREELGGKVWTSATERGRVMQGYRELIKNMTGNMLNMGIISAPEDVKLDKVVGGDPGSIAMPITAQLEAWRKEVNARARTKIKFLSRGQTVDPKSMLNAFSEQTPGAKRKAVPLEVGEITFDKDRLNSEAMKRMAKTKGVPVKELQLTYDIDHLRAMGDQTALGREFEGFKDEIRDEIEDQDRKGGSRSRAKPEKLVNRTDRLTYGEILEDRRNTGKSTKLQRNRLTKIMKRANVKTMRELAEVMKTGRIK